MNKCSGMPYADTQALYINHTTQYIGSQYKKARFVHYTPHFGSPIPTPPEELHMGWLSAPIRVSVGDTLIVNIRNRLSWDINLTPGFLFHDPADSPIVHPNNTVARYRWVIPDSAGPGPSDLSSILYIYRSTIWKLENTYAGLFGPLVVYRRGALVNKKAHGVCEFLWYMFILA